MAKRLPFGGEAGKWEFPGGKVEKGEDPRDALSRELNEELGIEASVGRVLDVVSEVNGEQHLVLIYFQAEIASGEPAPLQCEAIQWLFPEEIDYQNKPPADERLWQTLKLSLKRRKIP